MLSTAGRLLPVEAATAQGESAETFANLWAQEKA
jgi:hypothetical protein